MAEVPDLGTPRIWRSVGIEKRLLGLQELQVTWRCTAAAATPGRTPERAILTPGDQRRTWERATVNQRTAFHAMLVFLKREAVALLERLLPHQSARPAARVGTSDAGVFGDAPYQSRHRLDIARCGRGRVGRQRAVLVEPSRAPSCCTAPLPCISCWPFGPSTTVAPSASRRSSYCALRSACGCRCC